MSKARFEELVSMLAAAIAGRSLDQSLADDLNKRWPVGSAVFQELCSLCAAGERDGWLLSREAGGIKFGRAIKPGGSAGTFSVDVVRMKDVKGPHHIHPQGEIGAVMAIEGAPRFDHFADGWYVYGPHTAHNPTITGGDAYVLYLLPEGAIQFT